MIRLFKSPELKYVVTYHPRSIIITIPMIVLICSRFELMLYSHGNMMYFIQHILVCDRNFSFIGIRS